MPRIALLSTSKTPDLLSARASGAEYVWANPARLGHQDMGAALEGADIVVARILRCPQTLCSGFWRISATGTPMVVLGGKQAPNAALMEPHDRAVAGVAGKAHRYLAQGGLDNLRNLHAFLSDTLLLTGAGFEPPDELPAWGVLDRPELPTLDDGVTRPRIGVLIYRAQQAAGNTAYAHALCDAIDEKPEASACRSLPPPCAMLPTTSSPTSGTLDALRDHCPVLRWHQSGDGMKRGGGRRGVERTCPGRARHPDLPGSVPHVEPGAEWEASDDGMSLLDVATQVAVPEFDGRLITVAFSFKETDADGLPHYVADLDRCARVARIAVNHGRLRHTPPQQRKIAVVLLAYPTKHSRIGNAVGLDTPVSTVRLLRAMRDAGYDLGPNGGAEGIPGLGDLPPVEGETPDTTAGNALIHGLIAAGGQDLEWLTQEQVTDAQVRIPAATNAAWFAALPEELRSAMVEHWGEAPGEPLRRPLA